MVKVIFIEDVPKVARVGQVKNVADGYARNYLLPYKLAVVEGSQAARAAEKEMRRKMQQREAEAAELSTLAEKIEGLEITFEAKVGDNEKLYGSVTAADIAARLTEAAGHEIDKKKVELHEPIRQVGTYPVSVRFMWDLAAGVTVIVKSDAPEVVEETKAREVEEEPATEAAPAIDEAVEDLAEEVEAEIEGT
jgi:large subunit ribosomal protein L9